MEDFFEISLGHKGDLQTFMVRDYVSHEGSKCKFEVFRLGKLMLTLEPDGDSFRICDNPGGLDEETIELISDKIEFYYL
jgi:hypothetical protein